MFNVIAILVVFAFLKLRYGYTAQHSRNSYSWHISCSEQYTIIPPSPILDYKITWKKGRKIEREPLKEKRRRKYCLCSEMDDQAGFLHLQAFFSIHSRGLISPLGAAWAAGWGRVWQEGRAGNESGGLMHSGLTGSNHIATRAARWVSPTENEKNEEKWLESAHCVYAHILSPSPGM